MPNSFFASTPTHAVSPECFLFLQQWIHRASGLSLEAEKVYLLESRLGPVVEREQLGSMEALCQALRSGLPGLSRKVIEAMTTHETLFFRDHAPFSALRSHILPQLLRDRSSGQKLRFWSAAASSGQEAYSLAITLLEAGLTPNEVSILATDISERVLEKASAGVYGTFEVSRGLPAPYLARYFQPHGEEWKVRPHLRNMIQFEPLDLRQSLSGRGPFHVVFCRNVLIYFDTPTKTNTLKELHSVLYPGAPLFLGAAETVGTAQRFKRSKIADAIAYLAD
ncbi:MAG: protein-glutamate O-methyltransferase CheR [Micavibrio sp.]|nr:protein-glutamate O-methyltransferase CheR [Micavibrio sp.]